jgi:hypothetical protein
MFSWLLMLLILVGLMTLGVAGMLVAFIYEDRG